MKVASVRASPARYAGACPVPVVFSATIAVKGTSRVKYRWVRSDGSKGAVRTVKAGPKVVLRDSRTFTRSTRGWQAIQVLGPGRPVSKRVSFSVTCEESGGGVNDPRPPSGGDTPAPKASAHVTADSYSGPCAAPGKALNFTGTIQVSRVPAAVSYRWVDSDGGPLGREDLWFSAKDSPRRVVNASRTFLASHSGTRWIEILGPGGKVLSTSNRAPYSVTCTPAPTRPTASVTNLKVDPAAFQGTCTAPAAFTFTADIAVSKPATVTYEWLRSDGTKVPGRWEFTDPGRLTRMVSHTWQVPDPSKVAGGSASIRITSPGRSKAGPAKFTITCLSLAVSEEKVASPTPQPYTGPCPVTVKTSAKVTVSGGGPAPVEYYWRYPGTGIQRTDISGSATLTRDWYEGSDTTATTNLFVRLRNGPWIESRQIGWSVTCKASEPETLTVSKPAVSTWSQGGGECTAKNPYQLTAASLITAPKGMSFPFDATYRWRWADGGYWHEETVKITKPGEQRVAHQWSVSRSQAGKIFVDVLTPSRVKSEPAEYSVTCDGKPPVPGTGGTVVSVTDAKITPSSHRGACPVDLKATATITVSAPTSEPVEYAWVFDNGTSSPTFEVGFPAGGPLTRTVVWDQWRAVKSSGLVTGYLRIRTPNTAVSDPVAYTVTCV
ncbi:hypothetical protein [Streptosporangium sp. NPDC000396]|uniref:hypothetical protein n=1 Tax=Streptosporangium sp. NPDC000396 TaxID=3366185 RepID=UPI0036814A27